MTSSNVQPKTPTEIETLKADITAVLDRDDHNHADWIEIKLELCRLLAAARKKFKDNESFSKWFTKELGSSIGKNDRAAYIEMAKNEFLAREVFEATKRTSVQHIFEQEFKKAAGISRGAKAGHNSKKASAKAGAGATTAMPVRKPVFTIKEFQQLVKVLHSDRKEAITKEEMDKALALLMAHETELVGSKEEQKATKAKAKAEKAKPAQAPAETQPAPTAA